MSHPDHANSAHRARWLGRAAGASPHHTCFAGATWQARTASDEKPSFAPRLCLDGSLTAEEGGGGTGRRDGSSTIRCFRALHDVAASAAFGLASYAAHLPLGPPLRGGVQQSSLLVADDMADALDGMPTHVCQNEKPHRIIAS
ncbi:hypothetical protein MRX96_027718 [Rhipicephalus microplus]